MNELLAVEHLLEPFFHEQVKEMHDEEEEGQLQY